MATRDRFILIDGKPSRDQIKFSKYFRLSPDGSKSIITLDLDVQTYKTSELDTPLIGQLTPRRIMEDSRSKIEILIDDSRVKDGVPSIFAGETLLTAKQVRTLMLSPPWIKSHRV